MWLWLVGLAFAAPEVGADAYIQADAATTRFADAATPGPAVEAGQRVRVLAVRGELVRVRLGDRYGWVREGLLDVSPPAAPEEDPE